MGITSGQSSLIKYCMVSDFHQLLLQPNKHTMPSINLSFFLLGLVVASAAADETSASTDLEKNGFKTQSLDNDGFKTQSLDKDGFKNQSLDNDGFKNQSLDKDGFKNQSLDNDGFKTQSLDKDGFKNQSLDNDGFKNQSLDNDGFKNQSLDNDTTLSPVTPSTIIPNTTININTSITTISISIVTLNSTNSSIAPTTTQQEGKETTTPRMSSTTKRSTYATKIKDKLATDNPLKDADDRTGIIILIVIILVALACAVACYVVRKRRRRYSMVFASRQDEANIPLDAVEPELPRDTVSQNGLQTFASAEAAPSRSNEPEAELEAQDEQKADKAVVDPSAGAAALSPDGSEGEPKEDAVDRSLAAPEESSEEEQTVDGGVVSSKLMETNENNSNNAGVTQQMDLKPCSIFWDVPLDWPV